MTEIHRIHPRLFGTSGIRGLPDRLTPPFVKKAGVVFASFLGNSGTVLVGRDVRLNSPAISASIIEGLREGGLNVLDCGLTPTPALLFAVKRFSASAAVMVTGSHTPPPINGLLFFLSDTGEMSPREEEKFEAIFSTGVSTLPKIKWGSLKKASIIDDYLADVKRFLPRTNGVKVVVDPGNGAACSTLAAVLKNMGCEVVAINNKPDGRFRSRLPEPGPETLGALSVAVRKHKADLGVGADGDGDRAIFVTSRGRVLYGDKTGAIFADRELKANNGGRLVVPVNTSNMMAVLCKKHGGTVTVTRIGPPAMAEAMRSNPDTVFATEESGKYIWPHIIRYSDAAVAAGKLVRIMQTEHKSLETLEKQLPRLHQRKYDTKCSDSAKDNAMNYIVAELKSLGKGEISTLDGVRVDYPDDSWLLVRPSGTEPMLRCNVEDANPARASRKIKSIASIMNTAVSKAEQRPPAKQS
jgi:phosphomannomutase/phosphoglucomutase